jgi:hypothetical protein
MPGLVQVTRGHGAQVMAVPLVGDGVVGQSFVLELQRQVILVEPDRRRLPPLTLARRRSANCGSGRTPADQPIAGSERQRSAATPPS